MFDFDQIIDRRNTHAAKWDSMAKLSGITAPDAIAMWVADMDFAAPPGVTAALRQEVDRAVHGYYADTGTWAEALQGWLEKRHALTVDKSWINATPGIVSALGIIMQALSAPGDEVIVFSPAYHAFRKIIDANGRVMREVPLENANGRYAMDFDLLRQSLTPKSRIVFLCSPHNPGGTVWTRDELRELSLMCVERDLILVSDEIHNDLVFSGARHVPTLIAAPECASHIITCVAATKTFNIAGAHVGACLTPNPVLKKKLDGAILASGLDWNSSFGMLATEAAWRTGEPWLDAMLPYLERNRDIFERGVEQAVPGARAMRLASTYLAWVDFKGNGLSAEDVESRIKTRARIFASPGPQFGHGGGTWMRFNFATPRSVVEDAVNRLADAFKDLPR